MDKNPKTQLILDALRQPVPAISVFATEGIKNLHPDKSIFVAEASLFNIVGFGEEFDSCEVEHAADVPLDSVHSWRSPQYALGRSYNNGYYHIRWHEHELEALHLSWPDGRYGTHEQVWLVGESEEVSKNFYRSVLEWSTEVRGEVLVFHGGCWNKDSELFRDISNYTRDNLILADTLKETIFTDFSQFFSARELYSKNGIPWKRGVLFTGPPGNGKSHTVKALVNELEIPCLYVKSLKTQYGTEHSSIRSVFKKARDTTPCLLVIEDLDSHIHNENRSFFLNEMDGFSANEGILTLATCNYPERLDPAILDRPSRFDRKYQFNLPEKNERQAYLSWWVAQLEESLKLEPEQVQELSETTDGFSFAYLRELVLSSMMDWINKRADMYEVMQNQVAVLLSQMKSGVKAQENGTAGMSAKEAMIANLKREMGG